jgi:DNA polymerase
MLVGEQPGDQEDHTGQPFVGPAGRELDRLLREAGLDRATCYVTNAVKHFKWEPRGKRRLHRRPNPAEIEACNPWLEQEIAALEPKVIVALGATAARALLKRAGTIAALRTKTLMHPLGAHLCVTYHPSAVLRADAAAEEVRSLLLQDLRRAMRFLRASDS